MADARENVSIQVGQLIGEWGISCFPGRIPGGAFFKDNFDLCNLPEQDKTVQHLTKRFGTSRQNDLSVRKWGSGVGSLSATQE